MTIDKIETTSGPLSTDDRESLNEVVDNTNLDRSFKTRSGFVGNAQGVVETGGIVTAAGRVYLSVDGTKEISDLEGFSPASNMASVDQFPTPAEAYNWAAKNNKLVETDEPNRYRSGQLGAGFNNSENNGLFSIASQVDNSSRKRLKGGYHRVDNTTSANPGDAEWLVDSTFSSIKINIRAKLDQSGGTTDISKNLLNLQVGDTIRLQETNSQWVEISVDSVPEQIDNYVKISSIEQTAVGSGGVPSIGAFTEISATGIQRTIGVASSLTLNDPLARGGHIASYSRATSNINADQNSEGVRASAIGGYDISVLRGPEPDGTRVTTGEVWGSYNAALFLQDNGLRSAQGLFDRGNDSVSPIDPGVGKWGTKSDFLSLRINYFDKAGIDRKDELMSIRAGHVLGFSSTSTNESAVWTIEKPGTDHGTFIVFEDVTPKDPGAAIPAVGSECNWIGDDVFNPNEATDGKLVGVEIKAANWGGSDYDPFDQEDSDGENVGKYNIWLAGGGDVENAYHQPISAGIFNGNEKESGMNYFAAIRNVRKDYLRFYQPLGSGTATMPGVRALHVTPEKNTSLGHWADEVVVLPNSKGIGWYNAAGDAVEPGINKVGERIEITAPARIVSTSSELEVGAGTTIGVPAGGAMGIGSINAEALYEQGAKIVESGSNTNGRYVRFSDGTQVCTHRLVLSFKSHKRLNATWTYPIAFKPHTVVVPTGSMNLSNFNSNVNGPSDDEVLPPFFGTIKTTSVFVVMNRISGMTSFISGDNTEIQVSATGIWK